MKTKEENKIRCDINIRLPKDDRPYYECQLKQFCKYFNDKKLRYIQFGKQDTRGTESITFIDKHHCVPISQHFYNKFDLLGFVVGFNKAKEKTEQINTYLKGFRK